MKVLFLFDHRKWVENHRKSEKMGNFDNAINNAFNTNQLRQKHEVRGNKMHWAETKQGG